VRHSSPPLVGPAPPQSPARRQRQRARRHDAAAIGHRLIALLDQRELAHHLAQLLRQQHDYAVVRLLCWSAADGHLVELPTQADALDARHIPVGQAGLVADVLEHDRPILIADVDHERRYAPDRSWPETRARAVVPIHFEGRVTGALDLHSGRPRALVDSELHGLQSLADQLGVALHNCELYAQALAARRQAEDADRVKSRLLANVSHELRAPLNVILGYSQAALAEPSPYGTALPPALRHDLEHIYTSGDHLMRLINDLLDLSRAEVDALDLFPEVIALREFLVEVFSCAATSATSASSATSGTSGMTPQPAVTWRLELAETLPMIHADRVRLRQVLDNLLSNARVSTVAGEIVLGAEVEPSALHIWVRDTGEGIPADQQARIFEPFISGEHRDRRRKGIGLGLTITRRLVMLHGGTLEVESDQRQGSTFHLRLPLARDDDPTAGHILLAKQAPRQAVLGAIQALDPLRTGGAVLVVDDDPAARALYSRLVARALPLCTVHTADNGADALRIIDEQAEPPTLVILDVVMPEVDGFTVLERLRADRRTRHVPVLVVSGGLLSLRDVRRLDHARVMYQTKDLLSSPEALAVVQGAATGSTALAQPTSALVKQALAYLHQHYGHALVRTEVATAVGVSESYLSQIFHRELGVSPWDYLTRLRIRQAKELLSSTPASITAVAASVGFDDPAYFSRVFHKVVGETPHGYRRRN
jgi:signal transduction histidine kinase/AraC-like DNA-binding protein